MIREIDTKEIAEAIKDMCIAVNYKLSPDMEEKLSTAKETEVAPLGKKIIGQLLENLEIAETEQIPICQDTGMAVVFLEVGQDVHFTGEPIEDAVNAGVRAGYEEGYQKRKGSRAFRTQRMGLLSGGRSGGDRKGHG